MKADTRSPPDGACRMSQRDVSGRRQRNVRTVVAMVFAVLGIGGAVLGLTYFNRGRSMQERRRVLSSGNGAEVVAAVKAAEGRRRLDSRLLPDVFSAYDRLGGLQNAHGCGTLRLMLRLWELDGRTSEAFLLEKLHAPKESERAASLGLLSGIWVAADLYGYYVSSGTSHSVL